MAFRWYTLIFVIFTFITLSLAKSEFVDSKNAKQILSRQKRGVRSGNFEKNCWGEYICYDKRYAEANSYWYSNHWGHKEGAGVTERQDSWEEFDEYAENSFSEEDREHYEKNLSEKKTYHQSMWKLYQKCHNSLRKCKTNEDDVCPCDEVMRAYFTSSNYDLFIDCADTLKTGLVDNNDLNSIIKQFNNQFKCTKFKKDVVKAIDDRREKGHFNKKISASEIVKQFIEAITEPVVPDVMDVRDKPSKDDRVFFNKKSEICWLYGPTLIEGDDKTTTNILTERILKNSCNANAPSNQEPLFGCNNYNECHNHGKNRTYYEPKPFEKQIVMKMAKLAANSYTAYRPEEEEQEEEEGLKEFFDKKNGRQKKE